MATRSISLQLKATNGTATVSDYVSLSATMAGTDVASMTQALTASPALVDYGPCSTAGNVFIHNLHATVAVNVYLDLAGLQLVSVIPPAGAICLAGAPALYAAMASGTGNIFVTVAEA